MWTSKENKVEKKFDLDENAGAPAETKANTNGMCVNAKYVCDAVDRIMSRITGPRWC